MNCFIFWIVTPLKSQWTLELFQQFSFSNAFSIYSKTTFVNFVVQVFKKYKMNSMPSALPGGKKNNGQLSHLFVLFVNVLVTFVYQEIKVKAHSLRL